MRFNNNVIHGAAIAKYHSLTLCRSGVHLQSLFARRIHPTEEALMGLYSLLPSRSISTEQLLLELISAAAALY